jgi:hypothetical protein
MSEGYFEKALLKLARQLDAYDEASLADLWNKYEARVSQFEPSKEWEEAAVVFGMIQSVRLKNHLFNYHWGSSTEKDNLASRPFPVVSDNETSQRTDDSAEPNESGPSGGHSGGKRSKVLLLRPRDDS